MNITTFSDYTLRVLIYLSVNKDEKSTADAIARSYDISFHHVAKAAQWLVREGYVLSERGRAGGIGLALAPEAINIGAVLKATESGTVLVDCMRSEGGSCAITPACGLKSALGRAQAAFYDVLEGYTLADITAQRHALSEILDVTT